jgi:molybdopterin molybdotransferase
MAFALRDPAVKAIRLADAVAAIRAHLCPILDTELVDLSEARGRVLAEDLIAKISLPHWDSAAVDGFALRAGDVLPGRANRLTVVGEAAAGHPFTGIVGPGQAVRILTGAPLPEGTDLVVMQEVCRTDGISVVVQKGTTDKTHRRVRGEDVGLGSRTVIAGRRLRAQDVALAGALGCQQLQVHRRASVGLFSTGDELCEPGEALANGQIWDANRCILRGLLEHVGCKVVDFGILRDEPGLLEGALSRAAHDCDLLVTSGGMSVGSGDHIRSIIGRRGAMEFWPLAIKPGKPVGVGDIDDCPILALPGNPIAAVVAFIAVGRPMVDVVCGALHDPPQSLSIPAAFTLEKRSGVRQFLLAEVRARDREESAVAPSNRQGTAMLSALTGSDGFIVLNEDREVVRRGERVDFLPMQAYLS